MSQQPKSAGWVKYGLLAICAAAGGLASLYFSGGWSATNLNLLDQVPVGETLPVSQRFSLTAFDAKDTVEAVDVTTDPQGRVFLAWASKTGPKERTVFFTYTGNDGQSFEPPQVISRGGVYRTVRRSKSKGDGYERRATPHLAFSNDQLYLTWSEARPGGTGMRLLLTTLTHPNKGFTSPRVVHAAATATPTFTALAHSQHGDLACAWLDERAGVQQPFVALRPTGAKAFEPERLVYPGQDEKGVCPCCPTAVCFAPDGTLFVAFRNMEDGYRDIAVSRLRPGQASFDGPFPVVRHTWKFDGCPHDGPALAVVGDALHVVWMDARTGVPRCYHGQANLTDLQFQSRELHPTSPGSQGNAKLVADARGSLYAVWEESFGMEPTMKNGHQHGPPKVAVDGGRAVMWAMLAPGQDAFGQAQAVTPRPGSFQTRPACVITTDTLVIAWNELNESGKFVVVTRVPLEPADQRRVAP